MVMNARAGMCAAVMPPPGMNRRLPPPARLLLSLMVAASNASCADGGRGNAAISNVASHTVRAAGIEIVMDILDSWSPLVGWPQLEGRHVCLKHLEYGHVERQTAGRHHHG